MSSPNADVVTETLTMPGLEEIPGSPIVPVVTSKPVSCTKTSNSANKKRDTKCEKSTEISKTLAKALNAKLKKRMHNKEKNDASPVSELETAVLSLTSRLPEVQNQTNTSPVDVSITTGCDNYIVIPDSPVRTSVSTSVPVASLPPPYLPQSVHQTVSVGQLPASQGRHYTSNATTPSEHVLMTHSSNCVLQTHEQTSKVTSGQSVLVSSVTNSNDNQSTQPVVRTQSVSNNQNPLPCAFPAVAMNGLLPPLLPPPMYFQGQSQGQGQGQTTLPPYLFPPAMTQQNAPQVQKTERDLMMERYLASHNMLFPTSLPDVPLSVQSPVKATPINMQLPVQKGQKVSYDVSSVLKIIPIFIF